MTALSPDLNTPFPPSTKLVNIPWDALPLPLQQTCDQFIDSWWGSLNPDQPIQASGLGEMTVAEITNLQHRESATRASRHYRLITFMRIAPEDDEPLTYEQALSEKDQQELMCPEHIHRIEEIPL
jgi:hypothetical protein